MAGFLDGEGCFEHRRLSVSNTYRPSLERLQRTFGGTIRALPNRPGNRPCFQWYVGGAGYRNALQLLLPFLHEKRTQALLASKFHGSTKEEQGAIKAALGMLKRQPLNYEETL